MEAKTGMKKHIIIVGSMFTLFLLITVPSINAIQYQTVTKAQESAIMEEIQNNQFTIQTIKNEMKAIKTSDNIGLLQILQNSNIHELKTKLITELNSMTLDDEQKEMITKILDSDLISTILIKGIIIPVLIFTLAEGFQIVPFWAGFFVPLIFILPVAKQIAEETDIPEPTAHGVLTLIDITLAYLLIRIIFKK